MRVKRVTKIELDEPVPVYDLTVPITENFQLAAGPFVHNSKDIADAVAGAIFAASSSRHIRGGKVVQTADGQRVRVSQGIKRRNPVRRSSKRTQS
jgi:hypothetical protein